MERHAAVRAEKARRREHGLVAVLVLDLDARAAMAHGGLCHDARVHAPTNADPSQDE